MASSRKFISFLEISVNLFEDNVLYRFPQWNGKPAAKILLSLTTLSPKVIFPVINLSCKANNDSTVIYNTRGVYYPTQYQWVGDDGKLTWKRTGLPEDDVFAKP